MGSFQVSEAPRNFKRARPVVPRHKVYQSIQNYLKFSQINANPRKLSQNITQTLSQIISNYVKLSQNTHPDSISNYLKTSQTV